MVRGKQIEYLNKFSVKIPKADEVIKEPYTQKKLERLIKKPTTSSWVEWRSWAMVNYFLSTGNRLSTVVNIKIEDIEGRVPEKFREKIRSIVIPEDIIKVEAETFADCINLETIVLHDGMEICEDAFRNCSKLKYVVIEGYEPENCRFFFNEYYDMMSSYPVRYFRYMDSKKGYCDHIGEASFRQDEILMKVVEKGRNHWREAVYGDVNTIIRSHWIRISFFVFDCFMDVVFTAKWPYDTED